MRPVRAVSAADRAEAVATLAAAFIDDPAMAYLFPDGTTRPAKLRRFFALIWRAEADRTTGFITDDAAVALWRRPGEWRTPTSRMLRIAGPMVATFGTALPRALRLMTLLESHHAVPPHWYLEFVGCRPAARGKGLGGAVIRAGLARADGEGMACALETATAANVPLYESLGFVVTETFAAPGGLTFWEMWRAAVSPSQVPRSA